MENRQTPSTHWGPDGQRLCEKCATAKGLEQCESMTPGVEMSPADLVRNFAIEHYKDEDSMRRAHAQYWSPLETSAGGTAEGLEQVLQKFFLQQGYRLKHRWQLYSAFIAWWRSDERSDLSGPEFASSRLAELLEAQGLPLP